LGRGGFFAGGIFSGGKGSLTLGGKWGWGCNFWCKSDFLLHFRLRNGRFLKDGFFNGWFFWWNLCDSNFDLVRFFGGQGAIPNCPDR
jgi:hypothetical protein